MEDLYEDMAGIPGNYLDHAKREKVFKENDFLREQIIAISKAGAYDAIAPKMTELQEHNMRLISENAELKIRLKGALEMLEAFKDAWNSVKPEGAQVFELSPIFNQDDLKDINI